MARLANFICIILCCFLCSANAYSFLFIIPTIVRSHYDVGFALVKGLADAGHEITVISAYTRFNDYTNVTNVAVPGLLKAKSDNFQKLVDSGNRFIFERIYQWNKLGVAITTILLEEPNVQNLLKSDPYFDAVVCEVFLNEAHFGFAEYFGAPLIGYSTFGATTWHTDLVGTPSPPSYVPHRLLETSRHMVFSERVRNLVVLSMEYLNYKLIYAPNQRKIYREHFPKNKLTLEEARTSTSLVLVNQHVSISFPRPYMPNMIEVGGMHINTKRMPLPDGVENFIKSAKHGVIFFSLGSKLKSKDMPAEKIISVINAFRKIKYYVIWKYEGKDLPNKPKNLYTVSWCQQSDILAHPKVLAFITHGGLLSTMEAMFHGKPIIGIPIFGDQFQNVDHAEETGYGIRVSYASLTAKKLHAAILHLLSEPKYTKVARELSERFRDQPETPLERAVFWVEYVARNRGAKYLRTPSLDLNFVRYHNIDAIIFLMVGFSVSCVIAFTILRMMWAVLRNWMGKSLRATSERGRRAKMR